MEIHAGRLTVDVQKAKLHVWFQLEELRGSIQTAAESGELDRLVESIFAYLSAASGIDKEFHDLPWKDVSIAIGQISKLNELKIKYPLFDARDKDDAPPWDYVGRSWFVWVNILARAYGWSVEYIENLEVETGIALLQEVLVDEQLNREFQWGMSENAFSYDPASRASKFVPLDRPNWMKPPFKPAKKIFINTNILPMGKVISLDEQYAKTTPLVS